MDLDRAGLELVAAETLTILDRGGYVSPSGQPVRLDLSCVGRTRTWAPAELHDLVAARRRAGGLGPARVEVTPETTAAAARRLAAHGRVVALNFASAVSVGGGFVDGAKAQEEDLCRCSALHACLAPQRAYYEANRSAGTDLYTDHMILSADVPFFRDDDLALLERPFAVSILTAPAPCARHLEPEERALVPGVFERRVPMLLALAAALGHRQLVLGAWGCGAFRNDARLVADVFARWLATPGFGAFERVVFAVFDARPGRPTLATFEERLGR